KTDARLEPYQAFMREVWDEMNRLGIVPEGVDSRWKDRYVHLGRWLYTKDSVSKKLYELKNQLREALRTGGDTEALSEAVSRLQEISDRYQEMMGPGKVVIGQTPLEAIGDSKTRALIKKGFLRWRTHDTFADAVKAGLDTTNPIDLLKDSMFFESMAVAKHR